MYSQVLIEESVKGYLMCLCRGWSEIIVLA